MPHEVQAFLWRKEFQRHRDKFDDLVERAGPCGAEKRFELREGLFDRIEVGTVGRQEPEPRADALDRRLHLRLSVHGQIVEDDDIPGVQRRREDLLDVGEKRGIVDRAVEDGGRGQAADAQGGDDGMRLPVPARGVIA